MGDYVFKRFLDFCTNFLCPHMLIENYTKQNKRKHINGVHYLIGPSQVLHQY